MQTNKSYMHTPFNRIHISIVHTSTNPHLLS